MLQCHLKKITDKGGDPEKVRDSERKRFAPPQNFEELLRIDREWAKLRGELDLLNKQVNLLNDEIKQNPDKRPTEQQKQRSKEFKLQVKDLESREEATAKAREIALLKIGNVLHPSVPVFAKEEDGEECVTSFGEFTTPADIIHHHQALWMLGGYEPDKGAAAAGNRGYYLRGPGMLLNQALIQYALKFLIERKFEPVQPPYFMTKNAMSKVSQLSDFDESLYHVGEMHRGGAGGDEKNEGGGGDDKYLIATSEQPLCCLHMDEILLASSLPIKYAGFSSCFRKEAGKFGVDTWGIFRVHQFDKVEQFVITVPDEKISYTMLEEMRNNAEEFLKSLGLPFKTINVVSGELNLAAAKKYDINAWFPSLKQHKELVSASNCTDYQSRATNTVTVVDNVRKPVHLLNATLCALTRTICCIIENYQGVKEIDGRQVRGVHVPKVLIPFIHGGHDFFPFIREEKIFDKSGVGPKANVSATITTTTTTGGEGGNKKRNQSENTTATSGEKKKVPPPSSPTTNKSTGGNASPSNNKKGGNASPSSKTTTNTTTSSNNTIQPPPFELASAAPPVNAANVDHYHGSYIVEGQVFPTNIKYLVGKVFNNVNEYISFLKDATKV
jgi:seryl-tRNA synthetase